MRRGYLEMSRSNNRKPLTFCRTIALKGISTPKGRALPLFVKTHGLTEGLVSAHCAAAASPVGGGRELLTAFTSRQFLFRVHRLSIIFIWLKILQSWTEGIGGEGSQQSGTGCLHGNRSHISKVVPGQGAIFVTSCPVFDQKSRWL